MSDLMEIRKALQEIRDSQIATATDVKWIKDQGQGHALQIRSLEGKVNRQSGQAGVLGSLAGAMLGGVVAYFTRAHS